MSEATAKTPTTRLPAAARRRQLLDVALVTFADNGYHGTAMNDVAEAAGVTKPVLYQHFQSKRELYREVIDDVGSSLSEAITAAVADAEGPRQQVEFGFRAYFRWAISQGPAFKVLFADRNRVDDELAAAVAEVEAKVAELVASFIAIAGMGDEERHVLALGVVGLAESTSRHWLRLGRGAGTEAEAFANQVARLAWSGLRGAGG